MASAIRIGVIGYFNESNATQVATNNGRHCRIGVAAPSSPRLPLVLAFCKAAMKA
jgi:hypothetical protein